MKSTHLLLSIVLVMRIFCHAASASTPEPVPSTYQDLYDQLNTGLTAFNTTLNGLWNGSKSPVVFAANLNNADANSGPQLPAASPYGGAQLEIQAFKALGVQAVMVQIGFPMLYPPFFTWLQAQPGYQQVQYQQFANYYQQLAQNVRAAGLKLIVENNVLLSNDAQAGWAAAVAPYYATLDWNQYQAARAQGALAVAQVLQPDYMVVMEEPFSEAQQTGQTNASTADGAASLVSQILTALEPVRSSMQVGAGMATYQPGVQSFVSNFVTLPLDFIDMHIYAINSLGPPVNQNFLQNALTIAGMAQAAGKSVSVTEAWMWKLRDSEWKGQTPTLTASQIRARNPFSFWAPLDSYFVQTLQNLANYTHMLYVAPSGPYYLFAYQPYNTTTANMTPTQILTQESTLTNQAIQAAAYTSTGMSYYTSLVSPPDSVPPSMPLIQTAGSGSPSAANLSWAPSADNVGVAGYYLWRDGVPLPTTAMNIFTDAGLAGNTSYTYQVAAFDLGGNISPPAVVTLRTKNVTPPNPPASLTGVAVSGQQIYLSWTPSSGPVTVSSYLLFQGSSRGNLTQIQQLSSSAVSGNLYHLTPGTTYYFGLEATSLGLISPMSNVIAVTTLAPPSAPRGLAATITSGQVKLTWSPSSGGMPIANYRVYRGSSPSALTQIGTVLTTAYTDRAVAPKTTYYYAVQAVDTGQDVSPLSAALSVKTK
jgi:chitodextrinase